MSEQKFYRTVVTYEILSYTPLGDKEIGAVIDDCTYGEYSGLELTRVEQVVGEERIKELMIAQGSDPAFLLGEADNAEGAPEEEELEDYEEELDEEDE